MKFEPIEREAIDRAILGDVYGLRHFLLEGVEPNMQESILLKLAAETGQGQVLRLLFAHGAIIYRSDEFYLITNPIISAAPAALQEIVMHLRPAALQRALRQANYTAIVLAGDVCEKAQRYREQGTQLTDSRIAQRNKRHLGNAARYSAWVMRESTERIWKGIFMRSLENLSILRSVFQPRCILDHQIRDTYLRW